RYHQLEKIPSFVNSLRFEGMDVSALMTPMLRESIASMLTWDQRVCACRKTLQRVPTASVMLVSEEFYGPTMPELAAAAELGIPTIGIQHGTIMPDHFVYTVPQGHLDGAPTPTYFAAYSDYAREIVSKLGHYPANKVWVTGSARFDSLVKETPDQSAARKQLDLPLDQQIVLITTQTAPWFDTAVKAIFETLAGRKDVLICVKPHPKPTATPAAQLERMAKRAGADNVRFFSDNFTLLASACDVLISGSSTTMLEAILLGRKTICVNFSREPDRFPYVDDGGSMPARNLDQLRESLAQCLDDKVPETLTPENFLSRHAGPSATGDASAELARKVQQLLEEQVGAER
ncbi:MAG: CDP-glycerol glycerophosphotransferase family protein, partial [Pirellulales bacterium]|nr:CDP-glycerol glycerophosphotransferase family protein [Pirellulales bacterium]